MALILLGLEPQKPIINNIGKTSASKKKKKVTRSVAQKAVFRYVWISNSDVKKVICFEEATGV